MVKYLKNVFANIPAATSCMNMRNKQFCLRSNRCPTAIAVINQTLYICVTTFTAFQKSHPLTIKICFQEADALLHQYSQESFGVATNVHQPLSLRS